MWRHINKNGRRNGVVSWTNYTTATMQWYDCTNVILLSNIFQISLFHEYDALFTAWASSEQRSLLLRILKLVSEEIMALKNKPDETRNSIIVKDLRHLQEVTNEYMITYFQRVFSLLHLVAFHKLHTRCLRWWMRKWRWHYFKNIKVDWLLW